MKENLNQIETPGIWSTQCIIQSLQTQGCSLQYFCWLMLKQFLKLSSLMVLVIRKKML